MNNVDFIGKVNAKNVCVCVCDANNLWVDETKKCIFIWVDAHFFLT